MRPYRDCSIRIKLSLIALLTCVTAMGLASIALFVYEVRSFKHTLVTDLRAQATILAGLSTAALAFDDSTTASEMLGELKNQPHVNWAVIFKNDKPFARYKNPAVGDGPPEHPPSDFKETFTANSLRLHAEIRLKGERAGTIYLSADTTQLKSRLLEYAAILLAVFVASSLVALLMASRLQRAFVDPVQRLAETARGIAERQDYSVRVEERGHDELGQLTKAFNQMLNRIQLQDAQVRESNERFEIAVAGARDGIWDWNLQTDEMYLSPQWKAMLGYPDNELPGNHATWLGLLHPEDRERAHQILKDYLEGRRSNYEIEFRMRHQDASFRWILARGAALRDADGRPYRMAGSHTDITERKQAADQITRMQRELVDASRQAGMAEIATGILHNVGNVLNSVNVSANIVLDQVRKSKTASLAKAVQLLHEHKDDLGAFLTTDAKGRQLPAFFEALAQQLGTEQSLLIRETQALQQNVEHIKQIVAMQQSYAKVSGVRELLSPQELVEDALRMCATAIARHKIEVVRQFHPVPQVMVDRHMVLQILINLVTNAKQALDARADGRRLTLRITNDGDGPVRVEVVDNGAGIAPENLTRIFQHGFTTKKTGHGFGLHSGANAAKEMGGSLKARSDGPGMGAMFILEFPPTIANGAGQERGEKAA